MKLRISVLKVATLGPHLIFFRYLMQQLGPDLPMAQCQGPRAQTVSLFLVFTHIRQEDVAIISKVPPPRNANPAQDQHGK